MLFPAFLMHIDAAGCTIIDMHPGILLADRTLHYSTPKFYLDSIDVYAPINDIFVLGMYGADAPKQFYHIHSESARPVFIQQVYTRYLPEEVDFILRPAYQLLSVVPRIS
jgi:hypothetical protein